MNVYVCGSINSNSYSSEYYLCKNIKIVFVKKKLFEVVGLNVIIDIPILSKIHFGIILVAVVHYSFAKICNLIFLKKI